MRGDEKAKLKMMKGLSQSVKHMSSAVNGETISFQSETKSFKVCF